MARRRVASQKRRAVGGTPGAVGCAVGEPREPSMGSRPSLGSAPAPGAAVALGASLGAKVVVATAGGLVSGEEETETEESSMVGTRRGHRV